MTMGHIVLGVFSLNILVYCGHALEAMLTVEPNWSTLFTGESVSLICDMRFGKDTDWFYRLLKDGRDFLPDSISKNFTLQPFTTDYSGEYQCKGFHKGSSDFTRLSNNKVSLTISDTDVILENPASPLYEGESVSLRCRHRTARQEKEASFYKDGSLIEMDSNQRSQIISKRTSQITIRPLSDGSSYTCKFDEEVESEPVKLKVESDRPKVGLSKDITYSPGGGNVTLTCSVMSPSSGWKYFWYRSRKTYEPLTAQDVAFLSNEKIRVSGGGIYWCRGGRGNPVYYTEYSDSVVTSRAVVKMQPSWSEVYDGETITLACEIEGAEDIEWEYVWALPGSYTPQRHNTYTIRYSPSRSGDCSCLGTGKSGRPSTEWSDVFTLKFSSKRPQAVLTVSPLWLSPGDSVTLSCSVEGSSAGWRFYWFKAVPKLSSNSYSYDPLPGNSSGTEQDSYIVHGQTHTAGYMCKAGRGNPVYYTIHSGPKFVWSGDFHSAASLTLTPDRVQHFTKESVSLSCGGNSTEWRVNRIFETGYPSPCSSWGTMTGSTCNIHGHYNSGVYWCESEAGQFSNAVNITGQNNDIIVMSPALPVAEGDSVTLGCRLKSENVLSNVLFYKNGELIQNGTRSEFIIPAVSKSDEGFYKCAGQVSPQGRESSSTESWMSVKLSGHQSSPFPVLVIVGLVCGVLLIILLLLLLYHYTKTKGSHFIGLV